MTHDAVVVCTPTREDVKATMMYDVVNLVRRHPELVWSPSVGTSIANSRNLLVKESIAHGAKYVLFIDSDMRFPVDTLDRLRKHNLDIVAANCAQRTQRQSTARKDNKFIVGTAGVEEVISVGTGVMLIRTSVFGKIPMPWFANPWDQAEEKSMGEDVFFCYAARRAGFKIHVDHDLSKEVLHTGSKEWSLSDVE